MNALAKRIGALETQTDGGSFRLLLVQFVRPGDGSAVRLTSMVNGQRIDQTEDETKGAFYERLQAAALEGRSSKSNAVIVFCNQIDESL